MFLLILIDVYYMHNNNNYQCKMCWNKALTFGVGSIKLSFRAILFTQYMHAKMFAIQMLLHFSQIVLRVCTLVLFISPSLVQLVQHVLIIFINISILCSSTTNCDFSNI